MKKKNLRIYKDEFIKLYKEGKSLRAIALQYNVSKSSIKRYIEEEMEIKPKGLSEEDKAKCKDLFSNGHTVSAISKNLSLNYSTVRRYLVKEFGSVTNGQRKYEHLVSDMKQLYTSGYSATEISNKLGINRQTIMDYINEEGIKSRTYSETSRVYDLDENIFDEINKENAYILGIIFARGGIDKSTSTSFVNISIFKDNIYLLDKVARFIYTSEYPKANVVDNTYYIRISSTKLVERLGELGLRNNITKTYRSSLHKDLLPFKKEFFEGYFTVNVSVNKKNLYISGNGNILSFVKEYLEKDLDIKKIQNSTYGIVIENNTEVRKLKDNHKCIEDKILEVVNSTPEDEYHSWSKLL